MKNQKGIYQRVACACSEYERDYDFPGNLYHLKNHTCCGDQKPSCLLCKHFKKKHCELDLYDKIAERIGDFI